MGPACSNVSITLGSPSLLLPETKPSRTEIQRV
jgi:hypothetical protein